MKNSKRNQNFKFLNTIIKRKVNAISPEPKEIPLPFKNPVLADKIQDFNAR